MHWTFGILILSYVYYSVWMLLFYLQATFFISYVVTSGWTNLSSELTRTSSLIRDFLGRSCFRCLIEFSAPRIPYHRAIPSILFFGLIGITYFLLAPLILPFILVYFCLGYVIYRNQVSRFNMVCSYRWLSYAL